MSLNSSSFSESSGRSSIQKIIEEFSCFSREELETKLISAKVAGKILRIRSFGKLIFARLLDQDSEIQLLITESNSKDFKKINIGDTIGVNGKICKTNKGELSVKIDEFFLLGRCLKTLPDASYYGLKNTETRFRKRYLDFIINPEKRKILINRHKIIQNIRRFLDYRHFNEIETPILVSEASGAQAKPFITYHNKLQKNFYLRIATEIPLKKMLIAGFEKVYEIGRVFRNEGIDARHNPEFTIIEIYQAYENSETMMVLTEELFHSLAEEVFKKKEFDFNSHKIDIKNPFRRISMIKAIREYAGVDFSQVKDLEKALDLARKYNLKLEKFHNTIGHIILVFFENFVEKKIIQPTFICDFPIEVSPLAKSKIDNPNVADRFELYIAGLEFANGYSELNDPGEQRVRFEKQAKQKKMGNEEETNPDEEFIESMEYGMPEAGGLGIGIDRVCMLLTENDSIKEVIALPQLKNERKEIKKSFKN